MIYLLNQSETLLKLGESPLAIHGSQNNSLDSLQGLTIQRLTPQLEQCWRWSASWSSADPASHESSTCPKSDKRVQTVCLFLFHTHLPSQRFYWRRYHVLSCYPNSSNHQRDVSDSCIIPSPLVDWPPNISLVGPLDHLLRFPLESQAKNMEKLPCLASTPRIQCRTNKCQLCLSKGALGTLQVAALWSQRLVSLQIKHLWKHVCGQEVLALPACLLHLASH